MIEFSVSLAYLGSLAFLAYLWTHKGEAPQKNYSPEIEKLTKEVQAAGAKAQELEQRLDARELKDAMKGGSK